MKDNYPNNDRVVNKGRFWGVLGVGGGLGSLLGALGGSWEPPWGSWEPLYRHFSLWIHHNLNLKPKVVISRKVREMEQKRLHAFMGDNVDCAREFSNFSTPPNVLFFFAGRPVQRGSLCSAPYLAGGCVVSWASRQSYNSTFWGSSNHSKIRWNENDETDQN